MKSVKRPIEPTPGGGLAWAYIFGAVDYPVRRMAVNVVMWGEFLLLREVVR